MTAQEIIKLNPDRKLATNAAGNVIGEWNEQLGRYYARLALAITGEWVSMPYEIIANGKPMVSEWIAA